MRVCDAAGAIDFNRAPLQHAETYDLVLDLRASPAFSQHQPPQGYLHTGHDEGAMFDAVLKLRELVGEFDKPRFFRYDAKICAHSRNEKIGCTACIDVCSASAIRSDASLKGKGKGQAAGGVVVDPTCAWVAAPAPRYARAAQCRSLTRARSTRAGGCAPCSPPMATPAAATPPC